MQHFAIFKSSQVLADLIECHAYLKEHNPNVAQRFDEVAAATFSLLASMPNMSTPYKVKNPRLKNLRKFSIKHFTQYLIFYLPVGNGIEIIRVLHASRDIQSIMNRDT